tara:strand:+ start:236 stop:796 length:561 start_codon:yes stop_codon:yes gene_type:complete
MLLAGLWLVSCGQTPIPESQPVLSQQEVLKRGAYLVEVIGCGDCHSPKKMTSIGPVPDSDLLLSGHPSEQPLGPINPETLNNWVLFGMSNTVAVGPWGASFAANITSDPTGIGSWSFEQFQTAMTKGKFKGLEAARDLLPPMPWPNYQSMAKEDLEAIYHYLKSTKPVRNIVPNAMALDELMKNSK